MAKVTRSGSGWRARWIDPEGHQRQRSFPTKAEGERFLRGVLATKDSGLYVDPRAGQVTVGAYSERWKAATFPTLKPTTRDGYASLLRTHVLPRFGTRRLGSVRHSDVAAWVGELALSPGRARQAFFVLKSLMDSAVRDRLIGTNPCQDVRLPRQVRREATFLDPPTVERIAAASGEHATFIRFLAQTGLRWGEAVAIRGRDLDLLRRRVLVSRSVSETSEGVEYGTTKSHAERQVPLSQAMTDMLRERVPTEPDMLVFTSTDGSVLRHSNFRRRVWLPALEAAGVPHVGIHVLRHSAAAALIRSGASPKAVQMILGHASAGFTLSVYGHVFPSDLDAIGDALGATWAQASRDESVTWLADRAERDR